MTLKQFIKHFDDMNELFIYDWNKSDNLPWCNNATAKDMSLLFQGYTFDNNADIILEHLYKQHYVLELNEDGMSVMFFPYVNEHNAKLCKVQINVRKAKNIFDYIKEMFN